MLSGAPQPRYADKSFRRFLVPAAMAGLALLAALWSVAPHAAASSHCASQASAALIRDCRTLVDLKDALDPNGMLNWSETLAMEHWDGILASQDRGVSTIQLHPTVDPFTESNPLTLGGTVPAGLGSLPNLQFLYIWQVGLTGSIPSELGNLSNLEELRLDQNELTGSIPTGLGNLSNLSRLSLTLNQLSGGIPGDFGSLSSLKVLSLDRNHLGLQTHPVSGSPPPAAVSNPIPSSLGNLSSLQGAGARRQQLLGVHPVRAGKSHESDRPFLHQQQPRREHSHVLGKPHQARTPERVGKQADRFDSIAARQSRRARTPRPVRQ